MTREPPDTIELFPFRYKDARTGKSTRARYKATRDAIAARYAEWDMTGPGEVRRPAERYVHETREPRDIWHA